jgi:twin arginine-targeting protein translocase, TatA/E family
MFGLGVQELLLILVIVLIFFGAEKIPQLAKSLGKGIFEFKKAQQDVKNELLKETAADEVKPASTHTIEPTVQLTYITCPKCAQQTISGSIYCSQCGERIK